MIERFRYALNEVAQNGTKYGWWRERLLARVLGPAYSKLFAEKGVDYMQEDWDNLMILDACRADMFEDVFSTTEKFDSYNRVNSLGASSPEWIERTFSGEEYPDTVYVSANPWVSKFVPNTFHEMVNLWLEETSGEKEEFENFNKLEETSINNTSTIYPETVNQRARELFEEHPNKRFIIHYFQPHYPIIVDEDGNRTEPPRDLEPKHIRTKNDVTRDQMWREYERNLEYVFEKASELSQDLGGKSAYTSDHGEMFGQRGKLPVRLYGHTEGLRVNKLTEVPWATKTYGERRKIKQGDIGDHQFDEEKIEDHLEDLGYK